ncbi:MAG: hypothetical protein ABTQ27_11305 [Amaricoccus sp.]|uniref:hypothetical protein n=1 Tax=Amaricoccus sp. TaxID=1872485 RepID=UPI003315292F
MDKGGFSLVLVRQARRSPAVGTPEPSRSEFADWLNVGINEIPRLLRPFGPTPIEGDLPARSIRRPLLAVELADEARKRGRRRIRENKSGQKNETLRPGELKLAGVIPVKPLK